MDEASALLRKAKGLYDEGRYGEAEALLQSAGEDDATVLNFRGYLLYREGKNKEAAAVYLKLTKIEPEEPSHYSNLGLIRFKEGRVTEAKESFEKVLSLKPDDSKALRNLGHCLRRLGETARAEDLLRQARDGSHRLSREARRAVSGAGLTGEGRLFVPCTPDVFDLGEWAGREALRPLEGNDETALYCPGVLFLHVDEKVFLNPRYLLSYRGVIVFSSVSREAGKAAAIMGSRRSELIRAEGNGELGLSGKGKSLKLFQVGGESEIFVNYPVLALAGPEVAVKFETGLSLKRSFLATSLSGEGKIVLAVDENLAALEVLDGLPVYCRPEAVVAWSRGVSLDFEEGPREGRWPLQRRERYLRFEGSGFLVLQGLPPS